MTHKEILEKAIQQAVKAGWYSFADNLFGEPTFVVLPEDRFGHVKVHVTDWPQEYTSAEHIIFNHEFAKAIFGEGNKDFVGGTWLYRDGTPIESTYYSGYKHHLQQMVISEDPIKYLGEHMEESR